MSAHTTTVSHFYKMCGAQATHHLEMLVILTQDYNHSPRHVHTSGWSRFPQLCCQ